LGFGCGTAVLTHLVYLVVRNLFIQKNNGIILIAFFNIDLSKRKKVVSKEDK
jgi:hypothetical protein